MTLTTLTLLAILAPLTSLATGVESQPLSTYRWTHRLLVIDIPDTESGRATLEAFRTAVDERMQDVLDRDLLIVQVGDLPHREHTLQPAAALDATDRPAVRRRLGLRGRDAQIVLIGKDGGVKARQSGAVFDLDGLLTQIDGMPMRRAETPRR